MKTYVLIHESIEVAEVEIDHAKADPFIKEAVEFWGGWRNVLTENGGDYTRTFLKHLSRFLLVERRIPKDEEGWPEFDGRHGLRVKSFEPWVFDPEATEVVEAI